MKLIINADDFGLTPSVNRAIINVYKAGNLTSTTLMVNMPGTLDAINLAITFTNHLSTPIFLKKFNYQVGISPTITFLSPLLFSFSKVKSKQVQIFDRVYLNQTLFTPDNAVNKTPAYINWRYNIKSNNARYKKLEILNSKGIAGYAVVKKAFKKGVPFIYLLEIITHNKANIYTILQTVRKYSLLAGAVGVMVFNNEYSQPGIQKCLLKLHLKNKLNFLVKGKTEEETKVLASAKFNFSFGDLDFL